MGLGDSRKPLNTGRPPSRSDTIRQDRLHKEDTISRERLKAQGSAKSDPNLFVALSPETQSSDPITGFSQSSPDGGGSGGGVGSSGGAGAGSDGGSGTGAGTAGDGAGTGTGGDSGGPSGATGDGNY